MNWEHPEFQAMLCLGCSDPMKVMLAFQSYMHLCEVEKLHNVNYFYNSDLDLLYLSSCDKKKLVFHVPVPAQFSLSPAWLHSVNTVLLKENPLAEVNILLRTPDTTLLPYKLTEGLCPPPTPEYTKEKKALQEKIQCVQSELHKRKSELYEEAKRKRKELNEVRLNEACEEKMESVDETCDDKIAHIDETSDSKMAHIDEKGITCEEKRSSDSESFDNKKENIEKPCNDKSEISEASVDQKGPNNEMSIDKKDSDMDCEVTLTNSDDL